MKRRPPRTNRTEPLFPYPTLVRSGVGADVDRRVAVLGQIAAARVGPEHDGEADRASLQGDLANLLDHLELVFGARIDREADRGTAEAQRVIDRGGDRLILGDGVGIRAVRLENQRDGPGKRVGCGLALAAWCGRGVAAGVGGPLWEKKP